MEELTQEQITKSINAAFDSVNLINELNELESLNIEETNTLDRNIAHLQIMLNKTWFANALTTQQLSDIESVLP